MFKINLLTAWRNLTKNKLYSAINILGLAIGLASAIFILLYVNQELTYDKHYPQYQRIYRLESHFTISNKHDDFAVCAFPLAEVLKDEYPQVEQYARLFEAGEVLVKFNDKEYYENNILFADSTYFQVFMHEFFSGNPMECLNQVRSIVLTRQLAEKYFGTDSPIGKTIEIEGRGSFKVTGVIENLPPNTHLSFSALISMNTMENIIGQANYRSKAPEAFWNVGTYQYLLLKENARIEDLLANMEPFYEKYTRPLGKQINATFELGATRLDKVHLTSTLEGDRPVGNMSYILIFGAVAIFLLIIAGINYMNLATARAEKRAREVGIRKLSGAYRGSLIRQFLVESLLITLISLAIAILAVYLFLPSFNLLADKNFEFIDVFNPSIIGWIVLIVVIVGFFAGSYPAFYLSSFMPVQVLKGIFTPGRSSGVLRKALVVFQFAIAAFMIIATFIIISQLNYFKNKDLGFDKDNLMIVQMRDTIFRQKYESFKAEILQNTGVVGMATSNAIPGDQGNIVVHRVEKESKMVEHAIYFVVGDYDYISLMDIKLVKGRLYDKNMKTDATEAFIINEALARDLNWGDSALGKRVQFGINLDGTARRDGKVIGVLEDFNFNSLHNPVIPRVIHISQNPQNNINIRLTPDNQQQTIAYIKSVWEKYDPKNPFEYVFLDDVLAKQYTVESKMSEIFIYFSLVTLFIACLGLFGLSSFIISRRTKELGIRKVLGASTANIIALATRNFLILVLFANLVAMPLAYYALSKWLENFAFATTIKWIFFVVTIILTIVIALITTGMKAYFTARANPVTSIKYE